jgi:glyoxylase-like metal-dependent hydrolase (beta-lactamase superfamily II)
LNGSGMTEHSGYRWEPVVDGVFALAIWDDSWGSYNNCYALVENQGLTLVDTGKSDHAGLLPAALAEFGYVPGDVRTVLATHGHHDHIGGSSLFPEAIKRVHPADLDLLPEDLRSRFQGNLPARGTVGNFDCVLLGQHTSGSVALFHRVTRVLFCGDHICFFGHQLPAGQLVGPAQSVRDGFRRFVAGWSTSWPPSGEAAERMAEDLALRRPQDQRRYDFELFQRGLREFAQFDATALCTGHGPVLLGGIPEFIQELTRGAGRS